MATRLLSFLTDIEKSLLAELGMLEGPPWETSRTVSYHQGLARMTLAQRSATGVEPKGGIFLQSFVLADGSQCLKASLSWLDSTATQVISVYAKPQVNWRMEAATIANAWISGPPAQDAVTEAPASHSASDLLAAM
jgi:hypothetical protein